MNARRLRFALAAVAIGLVAVGAVLTASNGQSSRTSARPSATSDGDMPAALASHLAKLSQAIPGNGGEPAGESSGPGHFDGCAGGIRRARISEERRPAVQPEGCARCLQDGTGAGSCAAFRARRPPGVAAGRPGDGAVPVHAVPGRALVHAAGVRGGRSHDRPRHRPELRPDAGPRAPRREVPDVDHPGGRRRLAHEQRAGAEPELEVPGRELRDQRGRDDLDRPERSELEHALGRNR